MELLGELFEESRDWRSQKKKEKTKTSFLLPGFGIHVIPVGGEGEKAGGGA